MLPLYFTLQAEQQHTYSHSKIVVSNPFADSKTNGQHFLWRISIIMYFPLKKKILNVFTHYLGYQNTVGSLHHTALRTENTSREQDYGTAGIPYFDKDTLKVRGCNFCKTVTIKTCQRVTWKKIKNKTWICLPGYQIRERGQRKKTAQHWFPLSERSTPHQYFRKSTHFQNFSDRFLNIQLNSRKLE